MKKLLAIMMAAGITATVGLTVVSCSYQAVIGLENDGENVQTNNEVEITEVVTSEVIEKIKMINWNENITLDSTNEEINDYVKGKIDAEVIYKTKIENIINKEMVRYLFNLKLNQGLLKVILNLSKL